jgi:AcrR family transcriptional regulator
VYFLSTLIFEHTQKNVKPPRRQDCRTKVARGSTGGSLALVGQSSGKGAGFSGDAIRCRDDVVLKGTGVHEPSPESLGQRERNKLDKLRRIKTAAKELFVSKGYDDTTTREIAIRAGVGMGTVFTYADNKRDLLFLIANEDLDQTICRAEAEIGPDASLLSNLLRIFRGHYKYFVQQPELSRLMLREMLFYDSGQQANRFKSIRERFYSVICETVRLAKEQKTISPSEGERAVGWVFFCIYQVELRRWLSEGQLNVKTGMASLERALRLFISGLSPTEAALITPTQRATSIRKRRAP